MMDDVGDLPVGWASSTLGDVARWSSGGTPKSGNADFYGGGIPWAVISDLTDRTVFETAQTITQRGLEGSSAKIVEPGAVLIAMYGSIGKTGIAGVAMATNQAIACAQGFEDRLDRQFFLRYLQAQREPLIGAARGGTQQNISQTILKAWPIALPPLPEQHRIVEILEEQLSRIDAALESVRLVREKAAQFSRSLLHAAFTGALTGEEIAEDGVPVGWVEAPLGSMVAVTNDAAVPSATPTMRFVGMEHVEAETGRLTGDTDPVAIRSSSFVVDPGQVLYGRLRPYLNKVFVPVERIYASREFIPMQPSEGLAAAFLMYRLRAQDFVDFAVSLNSGDRPRVKWPQIEQFSLKCPPLPEQDRIVKILEEHLSRIDASLAAADTVEQRAAALRRSLLHAAFTGHLTEQWRQEHAHV